MRKITVILLFAGILLALVLGACATVESAQVSSPMAGPGFSVLVPGEIEMPFASAATTTQVKQLESHYRSSQFTWAESVMESQSQLESQSQYQGLCDGAH